tara:strand:- start:1150 stop:1995 length:846 start_codon:yes stop_codon:yes gene_type:complete
MSSIAFHFNGDVQNKYDLTILHKELDKNSNKKNTLENVDIFCFDNKLKSKMLINCLEKLNLNYINLGAAEHFGKLQKKYPLKAKKHTWFLNRKWISTSDDEDEHFWPLAKMMTLYFYLKENKSKPYFFLFDQNDVFLTDNPRNKLDIFLAKNCGMLFGAESKCMYWPMRIRKHENYTKVNKFFANYGDVKRYEEKLYSKDCYKSGGHKMVFLNGGMRVCNTDFFIDFMEKYMRFIEEFMCFTEQTIMHHFHFSYYPNVRVDNKCEIFQCMYPRNIEYNVEL